MHISRAQLPVDIVDFALSGALGRRLLLLLFTMSSPLWSAFTLSALRQLFKPQNYSAGKRLQERADLMKLFLLTGAREAWPEPPVVKDVDSLPPLLGLGAALRLGGCVARDYDSSAPGGECLRVEEAAAGAAFSDDGRFTRHVSATDVQARAAVGGDDGGEARRRPRGFTLFRPGDQDRGIESASS